MGQRNGRPDGSFCLFGAQQLQRRLQALTREIEGVRRSEDIEHIHRMRVASRRLRAAFAIFRPCFPEKRFTQWERQIRRITKALGAARDLDVQIGYLRSFLAEANDPGAFHGIRRLLLRLEQQRSKAQAKVLSALQRLESSGIVPDMEQALREALVRARLSQTSESSACVYQQAYQTIALRLEEMLAYEVYVSQPENVAQLHAMRIAAKHLRYTLELFEPLFGGDLEEPIKSVRQLQDHLGEIHDADVWGDFLPVFLEQEQARTVDYCGSSSPARRLRRGIEAIQKDRKSFRQQRYREFVKDWKQMRSTDLWGRLRTLVLDRARDAHPASIPEAADTDTDEALDQITLD